jgi:PAS domain S-box-containing protein
MFVDKKEKIHKKKKNPLKKLSDPDPYKSLFNNMLDGVFQTDLEGNYTLVNPSYAKIYDYKPEDMYKLNTSQTWASQDEKELVYRELKNRDIKNILKRYIRNDGSIGWLELSIRTKYDPKGNPIAYEGVVRDITERKMAENAEKEASEQAEFLIDLMTHDLNNINQGMILPLELVIKDPDLSLKNKKSIEIVIAQIQRSTELIRNAKRLQRVFEQQVKLERKDLFKEVMRAAETVRRTFPEKELDLRTNLCRDENFIIADDFLLDLFFNLFHNSMKFDKKSAVIIEVDANALDDDKMMVTVKDHGSGIPDEEKTRVLLRKRGSKGSGMGLTLVKYLVDRYNGKISLQDRVQGKADQGTTILMTFSRGRPI